MTTVDLRTRFESEATDVDPGEFVRALAPELVEAHGADAGLGATRLGLAPLTLDVDGEVFTFTASAGGLDVTSGPDEALIVAMDRQAFADLVDDAASTFGLNMLVAPRSVVDPSMTSSPGNRCCGASSTVDRCTSPARSPSWDATARRSTSIARSASTTTLTTSATFSRRPATSTSKACSPKRRWTPCRRTSTTP